MSDEPRDFNKEFCKIKKYLEQGVYALTLEKRDEIYNNQGEIITYHKVSDLWGIWDVACSKQIQKATLSYIYVYEWKALSLLKHEDYYEYSLNITMRPKKRKNQKKSQEALGAIPINDVVFDGNFNFTESSIPNLDPAYIWFMKAKVIIDTHSSEPKPEHYFYRGLDSRFHEPIF